MAPDGAVTSPHSAHADYHDYQYDYELAVAHPLPVIDFSVSVMSVLAGSAANNAFFAFMRLHYGKFVALFRVGTVLMLVTFMTPASIGHVLIFVTTAFTLGSLSFSTFMMSWQLLLRALTMQEIIFMSTMNWLNWVAMAKLIRDSRLIVCVLLGCSFQLSILSDVMFRTVLSASKSALFAIPLLVACVLAVFLRAVDVDESNYASIHVNNIKLEIVDVVLNMSFTLSLLVARNIYRQRRAFASTKNKLISCTMLKTKLMLRPIQAQHQISTAPVVNAWDAVASIVPTSPLLADVVSLPVDQTPVQVIRPAAIQESRRHVRRSISVATVSIISDLSVASYRRRNARIGLSADATKPHLQQLRLVPTGLKLINGRRTLVPRLTPTHDWSQLRTATLQVVGLTGLVLMVIYSISLDKPRLINQHNQRILGIVSFLTSTIFVSASVVAMQTRLLHVLSRHFDVLMNLFQALTGALCLCAMVQWDQRCLVAVTISLWFVWVVLFDAITPSMRRRMGLTKRHAGVALVGVMTSLIRVVVSLTFDEHNAYVDSEITSFRVRRGVDVELRTKSFFLNRMFPLTVWALRLLWELLWCPECELVFLKGSLEYYCPLDMLPTPKSPGRVIPNR